MKKRVSGIGIFLSGALLAMVSFPKAATPGGVLDRLALSYVGLVSVCGLLAAVVLARFAITRASHEERLAQLSVASAA
ncbi:hypothetical protein BH10PSE3_BH10PSE3_24690 [soil metagenome]